MTIGRKKERKEERKRGKRVKGGKRRTWGEGYIPHPHPSLTGRVEEEEEEAAGSPSTAS